MHITLYHCDCAAIGTPTLSKCPKHFTPVKSTSKYTGDKYVSWFNYLPKLPANSIRLYTSVNDVMLYSPWALLGNYSVLQQYDQDPYITRLKHALSKDSKVIFIVDPEALLHTCMIASALGLDYSVTVVHGFSEDLPYTEKFAVSNVNLPFFCPLSRIKKFFNSPKFEAASKLDSSGLIGDSSLFVLTSKEYEHAKTSVAYKDQNTTQSKTQGKSSQKRSPSSSRTSKETKSKTYEKKGSSFQRKTKPSKSKKT